MTITHEAKINHINIYPLAKPLSKSEKIHWVGEEQNSKFIQLILTIYQTMGHKENTGDNLINFSI